MNFSPTKIRMSHPCALSWADLEPGELDRFCNACGKNILDFSKFTDAELITYFQNKPSMVCGNFSDIQLNRNLHTTKALKLVFMGRQVVAAMLLGLGIFASNTASAQSTNIPVASISTKFRISGLILHEGTADPAILAAVSILNKTRVLYTFFTDAQGKYNLEIDSSLIPAECHVIIESRDKRVRYEEDVVKSELLSFFNRAIPFYQTCTVNSPITDSKLKNADLQSSKMDRRTHYRRKAFFRRSFHRGATLGVVSF